MNFQDWNVITLNKHRTQEKSKKQNTSGTSQFRALDSEDPPVPETVSYSLKMAIQKARMNKNLTQKQLAFAINVNSKIVNDYETGKAVPNKQILSKLSRVLGVKFST